jgi:hypothetical protein
LRLSILIPVYNDRTLVERSLTQVLHAPLPENIERNLIMVDDCSTGGTLAPPRSIAALAGLIANRSSHQTRGMRSRR